MPQGATYLVCVTEKRRKSQADTVALLKYLLQSQHVSNVHSVPGSVPGTLHILPSCSITIIILLLEEHFVKERTDIFLLLRKP